MSDKSIAVTLVTLESHNHVVGDIERGVKIYNDGGVEFQKCESGYYLARVPHKGDFKTVSVLFSRNGRDLENHYCSCCVKYKNQPICRHVVATVLAIQGGVIESKVVLGKTYCFKSCVAEKDTAKAVGSGHLNVFATPVMVALMERAACALIEELFEDGYTSVGTNINVAHIAASSVGSVIEVTAKIVSVIDRTIIFEVSAIDEVGEIGKGTHTRVIVNIEEFMGKVQNKKS
ncbi:MAG: thioesterase family protein [Candidatus Bathyarchaeota archaeon]|nr:thioesterase family protein [Candidatus Termiticorpusculum sp.]